MIYFQIFTTFGYKSLKNSENFDKIQNYILVNFDKLGTVGKC